jgi:hypothetical protein
MASPLTIKLPTSICFRKYQNFFYIFIVVNILTQPLSPHFGGGLMTEKQYAPIMTTKLVILAIFALVGLSMLFLQWYVKNRNSSTTNSWE